MAEIAYHGPLFTILSTGVRVADADLFVTPSTPVKFVVKNTSGDCNERLAQIRMTWTKSAGGAVDITTESITVGGATTPDGNVINYRLDAEEAAAYNFLTPFDATAQDTAFSIPVPVTTTDPYIVVTLTSTDASARWVATEAPRFIV